MLFLGDDLLAYIALALGGALLVGNVAAMLRPPAGSTDPSTRAPLGRSLAYAAIGLVVAVWALATLVTG